MPREEAVHRFHIGFAELPPLRQLMRTIDADLGSTAIEVLVQTKSSPRGGCHSQRRFEALICHDCALLTRSGTLCSGGRFFGVKTSSDLRVGDYPITPDGRYFAVRGRLWRMSDPHLAPTKRDELVKRLMAARRSVGVARRSQDKKAEDEAHGESDRAKTALGERGPVWWDDGAPDLNRHLARTGPYADWYANLHEDQN